MNKDKQCTKKIDGTGLFCKSHSQKEITSSNSLVDDSSTCTYILKSGKNKGTKCPSKAIKDSNLCNKHSKISEKSNSKLSGPIAKVAKKVKNDIYDELNEKIEKNEKQSTSSDDECKDEDLISIKNDDDESITLSDEEIESGEDSLSAGDLSDTDI
jgi:hypothetical protein